jgi:hypothetical protein
MLTGDHAGKTQPGLVASRTENQLGEHDGDEHHEGSLVTQGPEEVHVVDAERPRIRFALEDLPDHRCQRRLLDDAFLDERQGKREEQLVQPAEPEATCGFAYQQGAACPRCRPRSGTRTAPKRVFAPGNTSETRGARNINVSAGPMRRRQRQCGLA